MARANSEDFNGHEVRQMPNNRDESKLYLLLLGDGHNVEMRRFKLTDHLAVARVRQVQYVSDSERQRLDRDKSVKY